MDEIYRQYAGIVYRYLFSYTRNADLAEEMTQEAFFQAIRTIDRYDGSAKLSTWLCGIAKNVCRTWKRKNPPTEALQEDVHAHTAPSAESDALSSLGHIDLMKKLHALKEPYREVMYLRIYGALSFQEIGSVMDRTENWARTTFYRGKQMLRNAAEDQQTA